MIGIVNILNSTGKSIGTGFFVSSEGYLLTCNHVLDALDYFEGQTVSFKYANSSSIHRAVCIEKNREDDLALLQTDEKVENYITLCDLGDYNLTADSFGFPDGSHKKTKASVHIDDISEDGKELQLGNANSVTFGFSGAPLIYDGTAIGMIVRVTKEDPIGRMTNVAFAVSTKCILQAFPQYLSNVMPRKTGAASQYTKKELIRPITLSEFGLLANTYVERTELLKRMKCILEMPMQKKNYVYLSGIGGEGKSELARAYAFQEGESYLEIFWLTCRDDRISELSELFVNNHYMKTSISMEEVERLDERSLIIVDNCNNLTGTFLRQIMSETGKAKLIFTTRTVVVESDPDYKEHMLRVVSDDPAEFAFDIFQKNLQNREIGIDEINAVKNICHRVGYHPMAVAMIARDLSVYRKNCSFQEFGRELTKGLTVAIPQYEQLPFCKDDIEDNKNLYSVLKTLFQDFLSHDVSLLERQVLSLFYLMPFKEYKQEYICRLLGDDMMSMAIEAACSRLISKGWISSNGEFLFMHPLIAEIGIMKKDDGKREMYVISDPSFYLYVIENWIIMLPEIAEDYTDIMMACLSQIESAAETESENDTLYLAIKALLEHYRILNEYTMLNWDDAARLLAERQGDITQTPRYTEPLFKRFKTKTQKVDPTLTYVITAIIEYEDGLDYLYYDLESRQEHLIFSFCSGRLRGGYWGMEKQGDRSYAVPLRVHLKKFFCKRWESHYGGWMDKKDLVALDFPDRLLDCDITEIPKDFCKLCYIGSLRLPSNLCVIGESAFEDCTGLAGKIDFPESMEQIGARAFCYCAEITEICLPNGITEIPDSVFYGCSRLSIITLPEYLVSVGDNAFHRCACKEILLPNSLSSIGTYAFSSTGLENITIPESVVSVGRGAFAGCKFENIEMPNTVTDFREIHFEGCSNLISFTVPESITDIRYINFKYCKMLGSFSFPRDIDYSRVIYVGFSECSAITRLELPEGLAQINGKSFAYCVNLEEIVIPDSVLSIGKGAFMGCHKLRKVQLPTKLQQIGVYAFGECTSLETIIIPSTITTFDWQAIPRDSWGEDYHPQRCVYFPDGANLNIFDSFQGTRLWLNVIDLTRPPEIFKENVQEALCRGYLLAVKKHFQIPENIQNAYEDFIRRIPKNLNFWRL